MTDAMGRLPVDLAPPGCQRIIGVEFRVVRGLFVEEVALVPCDVRLPLAGPQGVGSLSLTVHTSLGDITPPYLRLLG